MRSDKKEELYSVKDDMEQYSLFTMGLILIMLPEGGEGISG